MGSKFTMQHARRCLVISCLLMLCMPALPADAQTSTVWVTMPDGVRLLTDYWLPDGSGPWPVVLIRTPYGRGDYHLPHWFFTSNGYALVVQSSRGRHGSEGEFRYFLDEPVDGHTTIEWISQQPWCDGNIGMVGTSGLGVTQYAVMQDAPPELKCLAPERTTTDGYHHVWFQGGALREELTDIVCWIYDIEAICDDVKHNHRLLDSWWDPYLVNLLYPDRVHVPILHIGGWYDVMQQGPLDAFALLQHWGGEGAAGNQYLIVDPMDHGYGYGELPLPPGRFARGDNIYYPLHMLAWLDHWLKQEPSGVDEWPAVHVYLMGACEEPGAPGCHWVDLEDWPPPNRPETLYLAADGSLSLTGAPLGERELLIDPLDPVPTYGGANSTWFGIETGPYDQSAIESRDDVLVFTTDVLTHPVQVMGRVTARIWIRPDTLDLDLSVRLTDVYPDGRSMLIIDGIQRARMRCRDSEECFLDIGVPTEIEVDLWSTAMVFNEGHRIRVAIAGINYPRFERNNNTGGDLNDPPYQQAHPAVLFGPDYPSSIELPNPVVFADGFESGDTSEWSTTVP